MREKSRIMLTILATLLEEIALVIFVLLGLPMLGVEVPLGALIAMMAGIATYGVISYRMGSRTLLKKPLAGFSDMAGIRGRVVKTLDPKGTVKIGGELWSARSTGQEIDKDSDVVVVKRSGLQLIVRRLNDLNGNNPES
jgi:membrane-bound ClpP family serine protease